MAVLAVVPYVASLDHPLLLDDRTLVASAWIQNEVGVAKALRTDYWHGTRHEGSYLYRPLTVMTLAWNARLAGSRAGFRIVNVALHAATTLLAFAALRRWMRLETGVPEGAACLGAAFFAVHPLGSEAVLWSVGRAETLAAVFGLTALLLLLTRPVLAAAALFLALCAKESAVSWIVVGVAAWALLVRERPRAVVWIPQALALVAYLALRFAAIGAARPEIPFVDNPLVAVDGPTRIANAVLLLGRYALAFVWPRTLSVDHGFDQIPVVPLWPWGGAAAAALALAWIAAVVGAVRRSRPVLAFLLLFPVASFVVTANIAFPIGTIFAERLAYTPLVGLCGLAAYGWTWTARRPVVTAVVAVAAILALAARTHARGEDYRDLATFHEATARASPRAVKALANVGRTRLRTGRPGEALEPLERAVAIKPDYERARALLGACRAALSGAPGGAAPAEPDD